MLRNVNKDDKVVLIGDFNARVGVPLVIVQGNVTATVFSSFNSVRCSILPRLIHSSGNQTSIKRPGSIHTLGIGTFLIM